MMTTTENFYFKKILGNSTELKKFHQQIMGMMKMEYCWQEPFKWQYVEYFPLHLSICLGSDHIYAFFQTKPNIEELGNGMSSGRHELFDVYLVPFSVTILCTTHVMKVGVVCGCDQRTVSL